MKKTLKWYVVDKEYVEYLKQFDARVQNIDYNKDVKPYIGILISVNHFNYYVPISSRKKKHYTMKEDIDFIKLLDGETLFGVLNLNNMIPIIETAIVPLKYADIEKYKVFINFEEKAKYIGLLNKELQIIQKNETKILQSAKKIYNIKTNHPEAKIAKRIIDFKLLEEKAKEYQK